MRKSSQRRGNADIHPRPVPRMRAARPGHYLPSSAIPESTTSASQHWRFQASAVYFKIWWFAANCLTDNFPTICHSLQEETGWEC